MNDIKEYILNNEITLIITSPNSKTLSIINLLNELSIKNKYKTTLFSFNISSTYYLQKLISLLSGINNNTITKYFYPHVSFSKHNKEKINRDKFIDAIEKIQNSNLLINNEKHITDKDYLDYILDYSENNVIIVDDLYALLDKTKYSLDEILIKVKRKKDIHLVLFIKTKNKEKIIKKEGKIIKNHILIDGYNYVDYKDININILNKTIKLQCNKLNQIIKEENNERTLYNN